MKLLQVLLLSNIVTTVLCHKFVAEEGEMFLEEINKIRRELNPTASKMMEVVWSDELATIATEYASECKAYLNPARNNQSTDFNAVGELHYVGSLKDTASLSSLLVDAVSFWNTSKLRNVTRILPGGNISDSTVLTCHTKDYIQVSSNQMCYMNNVSLVFIILGVCTCRLILHIILAHNHICRHQLHSHNYTCHDK